MRSVLLNAPDVVMRQKYTPFATGVPPSSRPSHVTWKIPGPSRKPSVRVRTFRPVNEITSILTGPERGIENSIAVFALNGFGGSFPAKTVMRLGPYQEHRLAG